MIDTIRGLITYATAAAAIIISMVMAFIAWSSPIPADGGRDIAVLFGFLGAITGAAVTFLFLQETATRASRAADRTAAVSSANALSTPGAIVEPSDGPAA